MNADRSDTAIVFIDPQIAILSPAGRNWAAVGESVTENQTVAHMIEILDMAARLDIPVVVSPHYFYPADSGWRFNGPLESVEFASGTFSRAGALNLTGFAGSGPTGCASSRTTDASCARATSGSPKVRTSPGPQTTTGHFRRGRSAALTSERRHPAGSATRATSIRAAATGSALNRSTGQLRDGFGLAAATSRPLGRNSSR